LALALLVVALPVILVALVAVKLTSRGPGMYTQTRVGLNGKPFTIYKVRTMSHDCESLTGPRWSMPGDPRITTLGRVLRKLHLDELPQLVNVLRGDMALVGPRPERPEIVAQLVRSVPTYGLRHVVKPGMTGFAQVHLPPDTDVQSVRNKVAYDRHYIRAMGPLKDLAIYACTVFKVAGCQSLYARPPRRPAGDE
jgi:lipopolysaccharide/colanic/teichoic acid biosynthesis glycosyltransferase